MASSKMKDMKDKMSKKKDEIMGDDKGDDKGGFPFKKKGKGGDDDKGGKKKGGFPFGKGKGDDKGGDDKGGDDKGGDDKGGDDGDCCESRQLFRKFGEWVQIREGKQDGLPNGSTGSKSAGGRDKGGASPGVKSHVDDLSGDYKGHLSHNGTVEPWKRMKGKGGKAVAPVGK